MSPILAQISHNTLPMVVICHGTQTFQIIFSNQNVLGDVVQQVFSLLHMYFPSETRKGFSNNIKNASVPSTKPQRKKFPHML